MIKQLYPGYFQKSRVFLYPLLTISKKQGFRPLNSYLSWKGYYSLGDYKLILAYDNKPSDEWNKFQKDILFRNRAFEKMELSEDGTVAIFIYDFNFYKDDFEAVIDGRYSKMTSFAKSLIQSYYGYNTPEWGYMETFLIPQRHYKTYAAILDVDLEILKEVGELTCKPDFEKEELTLKKKCFLEVLQ